MIKFYAVLIAFLTLSITVFANNFTTALDSLKELPKSEDFIAAFPYEKCFNENNILTVDKLEYYKAAVNEIGFNGDLFLMELFNHYTLNNPVDFNDLKSIEKRIRLGELMNYSEEYMPDSVFVYLAIGDFLLSSISDSIQILIDKEKINEKDYITRYTLDRLSGNKYFIDVPVSNYTKLYNYVQEGRWDYIWGKFNSTYKKEFYSAIVVFLLCLFLVYKGFKMIKKSKRKGGI